MSKIYWRDFGASLVVLVAGVVFLLWAKTYPTSSAEVPVLVAWITIILALIDAIAQTQTSAGAVVRRFISAQKIIEWKAEGDEEATPGRIASAVSWVAAYVAGTVLFGFLLATPIYCLLYMRLHGKKSLLACVLTALGTAIGIWFTFEVIFEYPLYPGLLFGGRL